MHPGQITALTGALAATIVTLVAYMMIKSGDPSKSYKRSTWHLTIHDEGVDQTWYIDTEINAIKIVQEDPENGSIDVQEIHNGAVYDYSARDPNLDMTVTTEDCDDFDLSDYDGTCEEYVASLQADMDAAVAVFAEFKDECSETLLTEETMTIAADLPCDGAAKVGMFLVSFVDCVPSAILDNDKTVVATINSVIDGIDDSVTFSKCDAPEVDTDNQRKLNAVLISVEKMVSNTEWCGANTDVYTPGKTCPGGAHHGDFETNQACRRHDMGLVVGANKWLLNQVHKLECSVDRKLVNKQAGGTRNWMVQAVFGRAGMSRHWGCWNLSFNKKCGWRHGNRQCNNQKRHWVTNHKKERFENAFDRRERCNDPIWGNTPTTLRSPVLDSNWAFKPFGSKRTRCFHRCDVYEDPTQNDFGGKTCSPSDESGYYDTHNLHGSYYRKGDSRNLGWHNGYGEGGSEIKCPRL